MKLNFIQSSTVIVEHKGTKIMCDPWIVDGEYYGSWAHYPKCPIEPKDVKEIDFIYLTHIHPDHFSIKAMKQIDKNIPVLINTYTSKFLKKNVESLGFKVTECVHNKRIHLKNGLYITILAADNCDPVLCSKFFGCSIIETMYGATAIDSMCVIDDGEQIIVNTNDCPFAIAETSARKIKERFGKIDLLLAGYAGAGPYPQCFEMPEKEKKDAAENKKKDFYKETENYLKLFKPKFFMPFAGRYTLTGKLVDLNDKRGVPELEEAYDYFEKNNLTKELGTKCIILNPNQTFDLETETASAPYIPINIIEKRKYIEENLAKKKFDYEYEEIPDKQVITELIPKAYDRFNSNRKKINFHSEYKILIDFENNELISISCNGDGFEIIKKEQESEIEKYVKISLDPRLFHWILKGPKYAHWNNAEIGSHLKYKRKPEKYERALYYSMSFFHS